MNMNMCNKCVGSRVCECGGDNGNGVTKLSAGSKKQQQQKQKQAKILKRGPGVAELEKILREQETTSDLPETQRGDNGGFSISLSWPCPNSSILNSYAPSFSPAVGSMYGNSGNCSLGLNGGGESSEPQLFPMNHATWEPNKSNLNEQKVNESVGVSSYNQSNDYYSDAKWGSTLELNNQRFNSENDGSGDAKFLQYVISEIPPHSMPSSPSVHSVGHDGKPFFNFLDVKDQEGASDATSGSSNDDIDLTLKL